MDTRHQEIEAGKTSEYAKHTASRDIENDIRGTRHKMDELIDRVTERLHPRHILDDVLQAARKPENQDAAMRRARSVGRHTAEAVKENPWPALLIGAGAAWFLYNQRDSSREESDISMSAYRRRGAYDDSSEEILYDSDYDAAYGSGEDESGKDWSQGGRIEGAKAKAGDILEGGQEKASHLADEVKGKAKSWAHESRQKMKQYKEKAGSRRRSYRESLGKLGHRTGEKARHGLEMSGERAYQALHNHPLVLGATALAAGILLGLAIPESRQEHRALGGTSEKLKNQALAQGERVLEKAKEAGESIAEKAGQEAKAQFGQEEQPRETPAT